MFDTQIQKITQALEPLFDRVEDSYERLNILSHLNDTVAYISVESYTQRGSEYDTTDSYAIYEATVRVDAVASRKMTAAELAALVDKQVVPAIALLDMDTLSISRRPCEYSKEQGRYIISVDIKLRVAVDGKIAPHTVAINSTPWSIFGEVSVKDSAKLYTLGCANGDLISGLARQEPKTVTLKAKVRADVGMEIYNIFASAKGGVSSLTIDSVSFNMMMLCTVSCDMNDGSAVISLEYREVTS